MARFNTVSVDGLYFSSDGTSTGRMFQLDVFGLDALLFGVVGATHIPIQGAPFTFKRDNTEGQRIDVKAAFPYAHIHEDIIDEMEIAVDTDTRQRLIVIGDLGHYDIQVDPYFDPNTRLPFTTSGKFRNEVLYDVTYSWIVRSIN